MSLYSNNNKYIRGVGYIKVCILIQSDEPSGYAQLFKIPSVPPYTTFSKPDQKGWGIGDSPRKTCARVCFSCVEWYFFEKMTKFEAPRSSPLPAKYINLALLFVYMRIADKHIRTDNFIVMFVEQVKRPDSGLWTMRAIMPQISLTKPQNEANMGEFRKRILKLVEELD